MNIRSSSDHKSDSMDLSSVLEAEVERLLSKASAYGMGTVWKQNEFSEILPFPKPLSLSVFRGLADHEGATGMVCRELGIFYNTAVPVEDYLETLFGRIFVNDAAERLLTQPPAKRSLMKAFSASVRIEKENRTFYRQFENLSKNLEVYYQDQIRTNIKGLSDALLLKRINELNLRLNEHYCYVVKAGMLANLNLDALASSVEGAIPPELLAADAGPLMKSDREAQAVVSFREHKLPQFIGFSASTEYELGCPRFSEIEECIIQPGHPHSHGRSDLPKSRKVRDAVLYFKINESLKVIFKTLLLRELYLLRMALIEAGDRSCLTDDIFYLTLAETVSVFQQKFSAEISQRKEQEKAFQDFDLPTLVTPAVLSNLLQGHEQLERHDLKGISITGMEFEGRALIYHSERDLERSDSSTIIIAKHASPNLVMAFSKSRGIITETGGLLSHLAIVAREQGFPLVLQARDAAQLIADGDLLRIDAAGKIVTI
jgi:phosphohistidine swiveling domain-containing protein